MAWASVNAGKDYRSVSYSATPITLSGITAPGSGNLLVLAIQLADIGSTSESVVSSITDNGIPGSIWVRAKTNDDPSHSFSQELWYAKNVTGAPTSLTVNLTLGTGTNRQYDAHVHEYSGIDTTAPLDVTASAQNEGTTSTSSGTTAATAVDHELAIALYGDNQQAASPGLPGGWTQRTVSGMENDGSALMVVDKDATPTGTQTVTFSTAAGDFSAALIVTFKAAPDTSIPYAYDLETTLGALDLETGNDRLQLEDASGVLLEEFDFNPGIDRFLLEDGTGVLINEHASSLFRAIFNEDGYGGFLLEDGSGILLGEPDLFYAYENEDGTNRFLIEDGLGVLLSEEPDSIGDIFYGYQFEETTDRYLLEDGSGILVSEEPQSLSQQPQVAAVITIGRIRPQNQFHAGINFKSRIISPQLYNSGGIFPVSIIVPEGMTGISQVERRPIPWWGRTRWSRIAVAQIYNSGGATPIVTQRKRTSSNWPKVTRAFSKVVGLPLVSSPLLVIPVIVKGVKRTPRLLRSRPRPVRSSVAVSLTLTPSLIRGAVRTQINRITPALQVSQSAPSIAVSPTVNSGAIWSSRLRAHSRVVVATASIQTVTFSRVVRSVIRLTKPARAQSRSIVLVDVVVPTPPIVLLSEKWARPTRSVSRVVVARVAVVLGTTPRVVKGTPRTFVKPLISRIIVARLISATSVSGAIWPKITRATSRQVISLAPPVPSVTPRVVKGTPRTLGKPLASRRVVSLAVAGQLITLVRTVQGVVRAVKRSRRPSQWITLTGIVIPVPPIVVTGERWARSTRSRSRVVVAAIAVTAPSNASRALKGISRATTIKPVRPAWYISQPSAIVVTPASTAGVVWPKSLRARSRIVVPLRERKPLFTSGEKWPRPTRATSRRLLSLVFNSGGLTPLFSKAEQTGKQLRAKSALIVGRATPTGTPPIVVVGRQKTKPLARRPRVIIGAVFNSGGLTPRTIKALQKTRPIRGSSRRILAQVNPTAAVLIVPRQLPARRALRSFSRCIVAAPFNSGGIRSLVLSGLKRNPTPLRANSVVASTSGTLNTVGSAFGFIAPSRSLTFVAPLLSLVLTGPIRSLIVTAPDRALTASALSYPAIVLSDAPVGYWRLVEITGTTAFDSSGNGFNGTIATNVVLGQTGLIGDSPSQAMSFTTALTNGIIVPYNAVLHPGPVFTAEFWMANPFAGNVGGGFFDNSETQNDFLIYGAGANPGHLYCRGNASAFGIEIDYSAIAYNDGTGIFHHWVWSRNGDGGASILYRDGVAVVTTTGTVTISAATSGSTNLGFRAVGAASGQIQCEFALYNYALSSAQVVAHYNAGIAAGYVQSSTLIAPSRSNTFTAVPE